MSTNLVLDPTNHALIKIIQIVPGLIQVSLNVYSLSTAELISLRVKEGEKRKYDLRSSQNNEKFINLNNNIEFLVERLNKMKMNIDDLKEVNIYLRKKVKSLTEIIEENSDQLYYAESNLYCLNQYSSREY